VLSTHTHHTHTCLHQLIHVAHTHIQLVRKHTTHTQPERFLFKLQFENCQPGFKLKPRAEGDNLLVCACVDSDLDVLTCDEAEKVIVLRVRGKEKGRERGMREGEGMEGEERGSERRGRETGREKGKEGEGMEGKRERVGRGKGEIL